MELSSEDESDLAKPEESRKFIKKRKKRTLVEPRKPLQMFHYGKSALSESYKLRIYSVIVSTTNLSFL